MKNNNYFMPPKIPTGRPTAIPKNNLAAFPIPFLSGLLDWFFAGFSIGFVSGLLAGFSAVFSAILGAGGDTILFSPKFYTMLVKFKKWRVQNQY